MQNEHVQQIVYIYSGDHKKRLALLFDNTNYLFSSLEYNTTTPNPEIDLYIIQVNGDSNWVQSWIQQIKTDDCLFNPLIVCLASSDAILNNTRLYHLGVDDVIPNTVNDEEFVARIEKLMCNKRTVRELMDINANKMKFLSIISHDLRNPFTILLNFTDILYQRFDQFPVDKQKEYLRYIKDSARQTYSLLENLLRWSRTHSGQIEFSPVCLDLTEIIYESIKINANLTHEKQLTVYFNRDNSYIIKADRNMLYVIINNLLVYTINNSFAEGNIFITIKNGNGMVTINFTDKGTEIPNDRLEQIFQLKDFLQLAGPVNDKIAGLGLLVIKEFVEKHGGSIRVKSSNETGNTFSFNLPTGA